MFKNKLRNVDTNFIESHFNTSFKKDNNIVYEREEHLAHALA